MFKEKTRKKCEFDWVYSHNIIKIQPQIDGGGNIGIESLCCADFLGGWLLRVLKKILHSIKIR